jgi:hypothetical protein
MGLLIFVFARVSCGRGRLILAEFAAVPNDPLPVSSDPAAASSTGDVRPASGHPSPAVPTSIAMQERAEIGGPPGPEPTRFGDWERNGRCVDF